MEKFLRSVLFPASSTNDDFDFSMVKIKRNYFSTNLFQVLSVREIQKKAIYNSNSSTGVELEFSESAIQSDTPGKSVVCEYEWRDFVNNMTDGFQISEPESRKILFINPAGAEIYGFCDPREIIGTQIDSLIEIKDYDKFNKRINVMRQGQQTPAAISQIIGIDGIERLIEVDSKPIKIEGQVFVQTTLRNVTKREKIRQRVLKSAKEREVLLQEIHHRVKNNLAIISGIITLHELDDEAGTKDTLHELQNRIQTLACIQEVIYESKDFSAVDIIACINKLKENSTLHSIGEIDEINIGSNTRVFLNINEAMSLLQLLVEFLMPYSHNNDTHTKFMLSFHNKNKQLKTKLLIKGSTIKSAGLTGHKNIASLLIDAHLKQLDGKLEIEQRQDGLAVAICFDQDWDKRGSGSSLRLNKLNNN